MWCQVWQRSSAMSILLWCIVMWCQVSHRPSSMSILLWCIVKWCQVAHHPSSMSILFWCIVKWCQVAHHPSSMSNLFWCIVTWCQVAHHPSSMSILLWCIVKWCQVAHHPSSMSTLLWCILCDVKSHTRLHQCQFFCDVLLCDVKSHTTLHQCQFLCNVLLCDVKSHTTLHQCQVWQVCLSVTRKYCFPTSFDMHLQVQRTCQNLTPKWFMFVHWRFSNSFRGSIQSEFSYHGPWGVLYSRMKEICYVYWNILYIRIFQTWEMLKNDQHVQLYILCTCRRICIYINKTHEKKTYIHTVDGQKNQTLQTSTK